MKRLSRLALLALAFVPAAARAEDKKEEPQEMEDNQPILGPSEAARPDSGAGGTFKFEKLKRPARRTRAKAPPAAVAAEDAGSAKSADSGLPAHLRGLRWRVYSRLAKVPPPPNLKMAHGYADLAPGEGIAVGFKTGAAGKSGACSIVVSPVATGPNGCHFNAWISATPGGAPLSPACASLGIISEMAYARWVSDAKAGPATCGVKASSEYFCNVADCRGVINSPLGVDDYTKEEALKLNTGSSCNLPGSRAIGKLGPDGLCRCASPECEKQAQVEPSLPKCDLEVVKSGGVCRSCLSAYAASCDPPNKVVADCAMACR